MPPVQEEPEHQVQPAAFVCLTPKATYLPALSSAPKSNHRTFLHQHKKLRALEDPGVEFADPFERVTALLAERYRLHWTSPLRFRPSFSRIRCVPVQNQTALF